LGNYDPIESELAENPTFQELYQLTRPRLVESAKSLRGDAASARITAPEKIRSFAMRDGTQRILNGIGYLWGLRIYVSHLKRCQSQVMMDIFAMCK
jgi:hypothetical protein